MYGGEAWGDVAWGDILTSGGHGRSRVGGALAGRRAYIQAMIAQQQQRSALARSAQIATLIAAKAAFEVRLAEARRQQAQLKTSLYATLLAEL